MTTGSPFNCAVVGVDGSEQSLAALAWACRAAADGATVHVVQVTPTRYPTDDTPADDLAARIDLIDHDRVELVSDIVSGEPAAAILQIATDVDADVVVVGVHQQWPYLPRRLGRVVSALIRNTDRPLVVVRPKQAGDGAEPMHHRAVVAGVGHGEATRTALRWAARFAAAHDTGLDLVRALPPRPLFRTDGFLDVLAYYVDPDLLRRWAMDDLEAFADEIEVSTQREVPLRWSTATGATGPTLVEASDGAELLVLGLHERSDATEHDVPLWLHHAVTQAPCPVVLVPVAASD